MANQNLDINAAIAALSARISSLLAAADAELGDAAEAMTAGNPDGARFAGARAVQHAEAAIQAANRLNALTGTNEPELDALTNFARGHGADHADHFQKRDDGDGASFMKAIGGPHSARRGLFAGRPGRRER